MWPLVVCPATLSKRVKKGLRQFIVGSQRGRPNAPRRRTNIQSYHNHSFEFIRYGDKNAASRSCSKKPILAMFRPSWIPSGFSLEAVTYATGS